MNHHNLKDLEVIFHEAAQDNDEGLDMEQFRTAMKKTMGTHVQDSELDMIFMKVDTNCDGTVDWDEYLSYMLLEYQEKENMEMQTHEPPFPSPMLIVPDACNLEPVCRISPLWAYQRQGTGPAVIDYSCSRLVTLSKEGLLNIWNTDWSLQKTAVLEGSRSVWLTDIVGLSNCNCVAVSSTDYEISFYSMTSNLIQKKFQLKGLESCCHTMDFDFDLCDPNRSILVWGDTGGGVFIVRFYEPPPIALFSSQKSSGNKMTIRSLLRGRINNVVTCHIPRVHSGWVQQVRYFSSKTHNQECVLSCCTTGQKSFSYCDITPKVAGTLKEQHISLGRRTTFTAAKGVTCLDYDFDCNLIVTGSRDCSVRMWNPYVTTPAATLKGHSSPVVQVVVRGNVHQIISVSKDKNVRIWDLRDYTCKQNIHGRCVPLGRLEVSALYFSSHLNQLVIANNKVGIFKPGSQPVPSKGRHHVKSHSKPVSSALYNPLFKQLVTGGEDSTVAIWDLRTGEKTIQFCTEKDVEVTAMAFDPTNRRLATGSRNGMISVWNFNNGARLRKLHDSNDLEVSGVVFTKARIVSAGWDKNLTTYADSYTDENTRRFRKSHNDDIMGLVYHWRDSNLASSSYDGDIFVWSTDTEDALFVLNMFESTLPMHLVGSADQPNADPKQDKAKKNRAASHKTSDPNVAASSSSQEQVVHRKLDRWLPTDLPWVGPEVSADSDSDSGSEDIHADRVVSSLFFLQQRRSDPNTAALVAGMPGGLATLWSVHTRGGMLGYFEACKLSSEAVLALDADADNNFLFTGDSRGYLRMWDISGYCNGEDVAARRTQLELENSLKRETHDPGTGLIMDGRFIRPTFVPTNSRPPLKFSVRAHTEPITAVAVIEGGLVATGSSDCSVRLWADNGRYVGTFGQHKPWNISIPLKPSTLPSACPDDIRRVGSPVSLRTIKGGIHLQWKQVKNIVNFFGETFKAAPKVSIDDSEIREQFAQVNKNLLTDKKKRSAGRRDSVTVWMEDSPHSISAECKAVDQAEETFLRLQREGIKSSVLGRINYKPKKRHKESKISTKVIWSETSPAVYQNLPCNEIEAPVAPTYPDLLSKKMVKGAKTVIARHRALGFLGRPSPERRHNRISPAPSSKSPETFFPAPSARMFKLHPLRSETCCSLKPARPSRRSGRASCLF